MGHSDPSEKLHFNDLNFIQPSTSNQIFCVLDFSLSAGVAPEFPLGEIKLFSFICTCIGCAGRAHERKVSSALFLPSAGHAPVFTLDHLSLLYWDVSLLSPGIYTSHESDTHGKCLPTKARTQRCPGAAGPKGLLCLRRAAHAVLSQPKTNWEAVPQCQF